jgi:thiol-disulfide isomerase/thioredoxin
VTSTYRPTWLALLVVGLAATGCGEQPENESALPATPLTTSPKVEPAPAAKTEPEPVPEVKTATPAPTKPEPAPAKEATSIPPPAKEKMPALATAKPAEPPKEKTVDTSGVKLEKVNFNEYLKRIAANKAKYTMVDAWATWCAPCKENFPHVVEMHKKYAAKGLAVASLSLDDTEDSKALDEAKKFLAEKKATFPNYVLDEEQGVAFEKLAINAIPAVFIFDATGKEIRRFTLDNPNSQFTYDEVEKEVSELLAGKPPKADKPKDEAKPDKTEKPKDEAKPDGDKPKDDAKSDKDKSDE